MFGERISLWLARRELQAAEEHEAQQRAAADYARDTLIPALRQKVTRMEGRAVFRAMHGGRAYQWGGRNTDRLGLGEK